MIPLLLFLILVSAIASNYQLRKIITMANEQEAALDAKLAELKTEIAAAAQRVIDKIAAIIADHPDLTDELTDVTDDIQQIKAIAPSDPPAPSP